MISVRGWLSSTDTPRWLIALGFAASTGLSVYINNATEDKKRADDNRVQQIRTLQDSMVQFQVFASTISSEMFESKSVSSEAKGNLIRNLNEQWAKTKILETFLPKDDAVELDSYRSAITTMIDTTRRIDKLTEMSEFWTATSKLLVARNHLNQKLQKFI